MEEQPTCGKGLAEHSALPAKMGELTASMAENLELHMKALDRGDESSRKEHEAYLMLARKLRKIAAELQATAEQMAAHRDMPMGRHDPEAMAAPEAQEAFERFVKREEELLALLQEMLEQHHRMLAR